MKPSVIATALLAALCGGLPGPSQADVHVHIHCKDGAKCPVPPAPPAPPSTPAPPAPPAPPPRPDASPDGAADAALPALPPAPPVPPAPHAPVPPLPPQLPPVPAGAHAACQGKAPGSRLTWTLRRGETMDGVCRRDGKRMVFELEGYDRDD